jgi:hypothetical protein
VISGKGRAVLDIFINLQQLAASLEALAQALESEEESTKLAGEPAQEPVAIETVRAVLAEKSRSGKQLEVKALITKYGANKLTDIDPDRYSDLLKEAEVL